jgi:hypothetical protein
MIPGSNPQMQSEYAFLAALSRSVVVKQASKLNPNAKPWRLDQIFNGHVDRCSNAFESDQMNAMQGQVLNPAAILGGMAQPVQQPVQQTVAQPIVDPMEKISKSLTAVHHRLDGILEWQEKAGEELWPK